MIKVIIIGAGGSLAKYVIGAIKELGNIDLTLFLRNKNSLSKSESEDCSIIEGDALNYNDVNKAITGQEIVYVNLAGNLEPMIKNIVKSMQENEITRIIAISSIGILRYTFEICFVTLQKIGGYCRGIRFRLYHFTSGLVYQW